MFAFWLSINSSCTNIPLFEYIRRRWKNAAANNRNTLHEQSNRTQHYAVHYISQEKKNQQQQTNHNWKTHKSCKSFALAMYLLCVWGCCHWYANKFKTPTQSNKCIFCLRTEINVFAESTLLFSCHFSPENLFYDDAHPPQKKKISFFGFSACASCDPSRKNQFIKR